MRACIEDPLKFQERRDRQYVDSRPSEVRQWPDAKIEDY
jgi:hypothetical protein